VVADYRTAGLSLTAHPLQFDRDWLSTRGVATVAEAVGRPEGHRVAIAGIVLTRQRPATAKGMIFLTIEDETGAANIVVHPGVWEQADLAARRAAVLVVHGRIQRRGAVVHVVSTRLESAATLRPETSATTSLPRMSRDFC
jgi:error-prone DNA polymerase